MDHNILVVEDEKGIREAIQIYLKIRDIVYFWLKTARRV